MPIEQKIHLVFTTITMVATQYGLFMMLSEMRYDKKRSRTAATLMGVLCLCICIIPCLVLDRPKESNYTILTLTLPSLLFFYLISKYRGMKFIVTYCIADVTIACVDMLGYCIAMLFFDSNLILMMFIRCIVMILWAICMWKFVGDRYHKALEMLEKGWGIMMLAGVSMYVLMGVLAGYPTPIRYRMEDVPAAMLVLFLMELMIIGLIRVIYNALELKERTLKEQEMNAQLMIAEQHYQMLSDNIEQVRGLKHDMKHHFVMMQKLLADGKYEELKVYMEKLRSTTELDLTPYGKNYHISVLAAFFAEQSKSKSIRFQCKVNVPEELSMSSPNLSGVLGNMWQNAIEACMELPVEERFISTTLLYKEEKLIVRCENSYNGVVNKNQETGELHSVKGEARGSGLKNIQNICEIYEGYCHTEYDSDHFVLTIVLPCQVPQKKGDNHVSDRCM